MKEFWRDSGDGFTPAVSMHLMPLNCILKMVKMVPFYVVYILTTIFFFK